jgi:hypothetical protein
MEDLSMSGVWQKSIGMFFSRRHSLECIAAIIAIVGSLGVLQTFLIGKHFLIPTIILSAVLLFGNLAWWGFVGQRWAKYFLFWSTFLLTLHGFFALFWAKKYREILGDAFEPTFIVLVVVLSYLVFDYAKRNKLFG